jgi:hypothetical protein
VSQIGNFAALFVPGIRRSVTETWTGQRQSEGVFTTRKNNGAGARRLLSVLAFAAICLSGCGGQKQQSETDRAFMNVEFSLADLAVAQQVARSARDGSGQLEQPTQRYIALTRKYDDELGDEEIRRRLADKATEVQDWCPSCAAALERERETYD